MFINFNYIMYLLLSCVISYVTLKYTLLSCARVRVRACARVRVCACARVRVGWVGGWVFVAVVFATIVLVLLLCVCLSGVRYCQV